MNLNRENLVPLATRWRRVTALLIDHTIMCSLGAMSCFVFLGPKWDTSPTFSIVPMFAVFLVVMLIYLSKDNCGGVSPGRFVLGIRVRDKGSPERVPSVARLMMRNILLPIWPVELIVLLLSKSRRRIGDRIANTVVMCAPDSRGYRIASFVAGAVVLSLLFIVFISHIVRNSSAYEVAVAHLATQQEIVSRVGPDANPGTFPTGSVRVNNGYGEAELRISLDSAEGEVDATVTLQMSPTSGWRVTAVEIDGDS